MLSCGSPWGHKESVMTERLFRTSPFMDFPSGSMVKNQPAMQEFEETQFQSLGQEDPWRRAWRLTPVSLPE